MGTHRTWFEDARSHFTRSSAEKRLFWFLAAAAVGLAIALLAGRKPWDTNFLTEEASLRAIVTAWMWIAAAGNLLLTGLLLATAKIWMRWSCSATAQADPPALRKTARLSLRPSIFWIGAATAALLLVSESLPRLNLSLWNDEEYAAIRNVFGRYVVEEGEVRLERPDWQTTIWLYAKPTNHVPQTIASRLAMDLWLAVARPDGFAFREWVIRLPPLLFGVAAVFLMAGFVRSLAGSVAGLVAAFLLAVHPWFVRFASEARGYSLSLAALIATLWILHFALTGNRWRDWLLYGASLLVSIAAYPGIIYSAIFLNIAIVGFLLLARERPVGFRTAAITRWFIACTLAGMLFLQLMAPCVPQFLDYLKSARGETSMVDADWIYGTLAYLVSGVPWEAWGWRPGTIDLQHLADVVPGGPIVLGLIAIGLWLCGAALLLRKRPALLACLLAIVAGTMLAVLLASQSSVPFWEWYVCQDLIPVIVLTACAIPLMVRLGQSERSRTIISVATGAIVILGYSVFELPVHRAIRTAPVIPLREAVLTMRGTLDPYDPAQNQICTLGFAHFPRLYDPRMELIHDAGSFSERCEAADRDGRHLCAMIYARDRMNPRFKTIFQILETRFTLIQQLRASQPYEELLVYEAKPRQMNTTVRQPQLPAGTESSAAPAEAPRHASPAPVPRAPDAPRQ